jgi:hypothetical protein
LAECLLPKQDVVGSNPITRFESTRDRSRVEAWDLLLFNGQEGVPVWV